MRTVWVIFARNHSTVTRPRTNAFGLIRPVIGAPLRPARRQAFDQHHPSRDSLFEDRSRAVVGHRAARLAAVAGARAADLRRDRARLDLALEAAARRAVRAVQTAQAARLVSRRRLLQQLPAAH